MLYCIVLYCIVLSCVDVDEAVNTWRANICEGGRLLGLASVVNGLATLFANTQGLVFECSYEALQGTVELLQSHANK